MNDYIKREDTVEKIKADCGRFDHVPKRVVDFFILGMESVPSADVVEVRHGQWIEDLTNPYGIRYVCSVCGGVKQWKSNYCPNCGAKMDEEKQEDE